MKELLNLVLYAIGPRRRPWYLLVALAVFVSLLEAAAALAIAALLALVVAPGRPLQMPVVGDRLTGLGSGGDGSAHLLLGSMLAIFFLVRGAFALLQVYAQSRIGQMTGVDLSRRLLDGYLRMPFVFHLSRNSAELIRNAYTTAAEVVVYVLVPMVQGVSELLVMMGLACVLLLAAPVPALLAGAVLAAGTVLIQRLIRPRLLSYGDESNRYMGATLQWLQQSITGVREIRTLAVERFFLERFVDERRKLARANYMRSSVIEAPRLAIETAVVLFVVALLLVTLAAERSPRAAFAVIGLFAYAAFRALPSVNRVLAAVNNFRFGEAALRTVCSDLRRVESIDPKADPRLVRGAVEEIRLDDVTFFYEETERPALDSVSFGFSAGEMIGIAGGTGSGKSTLVHILTGLIAPSSGQLLVNGSPLPSRGWRWDGQVGFVTQEVFLINDTIRRNIALGVPDLEVDEERLESVLRAAQLEQAVAESLNGLETMVGDQGMRLSGGQRQRISIARAMYHSPDVLILDEGTSALDVLTEAKLLSALSVAPRPRTVIHVAHRLTSLRSCDRIFVLDHGRLIDEGSFGELSTRNEAFRAAARSPAPTQGE